MLRVDSSFSQVGVVAVLDSPPPFELMLNVAEGVSDSFTSDATRLNIKP